jgi:hypothetical protein
LDESYAYDASLNGGSGGYIDDPDTWVLMATIHDIENPAYFYADGSASNNFIDDNFGTSGIDDHYNNRISDFTTVDSYLDRWTVYGV